MKLDIRRKLSVIYKDPVSAYSTFDFFGTGKISINDVLNNKAIKKIAEGIYT